MRVVSHAVWKSCDPLLQPSATTGTSSSITPSSSIRRNSREPQYFSVSSPAEATQRCTSWRTLKRTYSPSEVATRLGSWVTTRSENVPMTVKPSCRRLDRLVRHLRPNGSNPPHFQATGRGVPKCYGVFGELTGLQADGCDHSAFPPARRVTWARRSLPST